MEAERYIDTGTAARLMGVHSNTVLNMIDAGKLQAVPMDGDKGRGGKSWLIALASMPLESRVAYITQVDTIHPLPEGLLAAYREAYPKTGMQVLWHRHQVVMEAKTDATFADYKKTTAARERIAAKYNISTRTLYRWCKAYDAEGIAGLMDKIEQSNKGVPKTLCLLAQDYAKDRMFGISRRTRAAAYDDLKKQAAALGKRACTNNCVHCADSLVRREFALAGMANEYELCDRAGNGMIVPQSSATFNRFVSTIPKDEMAYARHGKRYWEAKYMPKAERERPTKANECWFGDHHMMDIIVIDEDNNNALVRPWITVWSDAATGCFVGYCVTTNPNSTTITETFIRAIVKKSGSEFWGMPCIIYIDNGKDYRSKKFEGERETEHVLGRLNESLETVGVLRQLGIAVIHAQPYKAWSKTIERIFGTIEKRWGRELPGWIGNSPSARPEIMTTAKLRKMAANGELLTLRQFEQVLREQIVPAYHNERFGNELSPIEQYRALPRAREDMPSWDVLDMIKKERESRKVFPRGIQLGKCWYWHEDLRRLVDKYVTVRYDKEDMSVVTIIDGKRFICHATVKERLAMINGDPEKVAAHIQKQRSTQHEVIGGIDHAHRAVDIGIRKRNAIYEPIDLKQVGYAGKTTTEFRRAAKSKAAFEQERRIRDGCEEDAAHDKVLERFKQMGRELIAHD